MCTARRVCGSFRSSVQPADLQAFQGSLPRLPALSRYSQLLPTGQARSLAELLPAPALIPPLAWMAGLCLWKDLGPAGKLGETSGSKAQPGWGWNRGYKLQCLHSARWLHTGIRIGNENDSRLAWEPQARHLLHLQRKSSCSDVPRGYEGEFDVESVTW